MSERNFIFRRDFKTVEEMTNVHDRLEDIRESQRYEDVASELQRRAALIDEKIRRLDKAKRVSREVLDLEFTI